MALVLKDYKATKHTGLRKHKDGSKYLFDILIDGKRYRKTYQSKADNLSSSDSLKQAYKHFEDWVQQKKKEISSSVDFSSTVDAYYAKSKALNSWNKRTTYQYDKVYENYIQEYLGAKKIIDVTPANFSTLNAKVNHLAKGTQKKLYDILIPLFNLAVEDEIINRSPIKRTHVPKRDQLSEKKVVLNAVEKYKKLYKTIHQLFNSTDIVMLEDGRELQCSINPHHLALFLFGFHGRRLAESTSLKWTDIDFINNKYRIRKETSKIGTDMIFTLPKDIKEQLLKFSDISGNVFKIKEPKKWYPHIREISGIEEFSFHWMRNLAVSALSASGVNATELSAMLGHTDTGTLKKYLSLQRESATQETSNASQRLLV